MSSELPSSSTPLRDSTMHRPNCIKKLLKKSLEIFFPSLTFAKFFLSAIIPPLADNIIPLFFTGNIPNESALAVAGQFMFISIILEVVQEGVVNSLFNFVGKNYVSDKEKALQAFKLCLVILLVCGLLLTGAMILLTPQFIKAIGTPDSIVEATRTFLYTSSFSYVPTLLTSAFSNHLLITTSSWLIAAQASNVVIAFLINLFLFGQQDWSLHWGIDRLGYYKVIQSLSSFLINFTFVLIIEKMSPKKFIFGIPLFENLKSNFKDFFIISWGNFGDSGIRNFFYFMVTLKFVNNLGEDEIGAWNLLNSVVWGLLLIPGFTVANYVKVKIGHNSSKHTIRRIAKESAVCLTGWILIVVILSAILWPNLAAFFSTANKDVQILSKKMFYHVGWIFVIFACNNAMDSLFFGTGKTEYVFYQSLITNLVVYFIPWILYLCKILQPTYWWVLGLYIAGMLVDFCLTSIFCIRVWKSIPD